MKKPIFKAIKQSMIDSSFMDFYFPENTNHPFVTEMKSYQEKSSNLRLQIITAKTENQLKNIAEILDIQQKLFDKLSKDDFPGVNHFFSGQYSNTFNFQDLIKFHEINYNEQSFLQKIKSNLSGSVPEQYIPSQSVKESIFNDMGFQYLYVPHRNLNSFQSERAYYNFIEQSNHLMSHMGKSNKAISLNGELGVYLETTTPLYGHEPKCIGFTPNITPSSLLHEWTHAIDNHIFHKLSGINDFASENKDNFIVKNKNFLPAYEAIKSVLFKVCNNAKDTPTNSHEVLGKNLSTYFYNCRAADEDLFMTPSKYFQKPCEILARMTESGEFNNHTQKLNKDMMSLVYLSDNLNPYKEMKDIFFSVVDKPTLKIFQLREQYLNISDNKPSILKNSI